MIQIHEDLNNEYIKLYGLSTPGCKLIKYEDKIVGMVDYNIYDEGIKINYITVDPQFRHLGIAKEVIYTIMNNNPNKYLYGDAVPLAMKFWESLGAEFDEDEDDYLTPFIIECK